jgi:IS1 family transposase
MVIMGLRAKAKLAAFNSIRPRAISIQFDDMETFEHTKCKPVSIFLAVENPTRRILNYSVARMPAKGLLARKSLKKYGIRKDERSAARKKSFLELTKIVDQYAEIKSDENPHYPNDVKRHFPNAKYKTYKGRASSIVGQGELKKTGFDPLFSLNHTAATLRARASRLIRRTWCTTKKPEMLDLHLALVCLHHNMQLNI